jgi:hypothetical protein
LKKEELIMTNIRNYYRKHSSIILILFFIIIFLVIVIFPDVVILSINQIKKPENINIIVTIFLVIATVLLWRATHHLYEIAKSQLAISTIIAFQGDWHSIRTRLMRRYLSDEKFKKTFKKGIKKSYGKTINFTKIEQLLKVPKTISSKSLEKFRECLEQDIYIDRATGKPLFTAYEAVDYMLLIWDRLAVIRDNNEAAKIIKTYKPPIKDLKDVLQAFISIRITLTIDKEEKNYKKDFMMMLYYLDLHDESLFKKCVDGLKMTEDQLNKEEKIKRKLYQ